MLYINSTLTLETITSLQRTPPPPPSPPAPQRIFENQYVQVQTEPEPPVVLPPPQPVIEEHAFKQTTTKRRIENQDESDQEIIADEPQSKVRNKISSFIKSNVSVG